MFMFKFGLLLSGIVVFVVGRFWCCMREFVFFLWMFVGVVVLFLSNNFDELFVIFLGKCMCFFVMFFVGFVGIFYIFFLFVMVLLKIYVGLENKGVMVFLVELLLCDWICCMVVLGLLFCCLIVVSNFVGELFCCNKLVFRI